MALILYLIGVAAGLCAEFQYRDEPLPWWGEIIVSLCWPLVATVFVLVSVYDKVEGLS